MDKGRGTDLDNTTYVAFHQQQETIAFKTRGRSDGLSCESQAEVAYALKNPGEGGRSNDRTVCVKESVRRLCPSECEALQGFPAGYTAIQYRGKPAADGPRYRALGNSMAVPCMWWIGSRIAQATQQDFCEAE